MKLSVVIPMYNEEKIAADTVRALDAQLRADFGSGGYEMLFVNDGSNDACGTLTEALRPAFPALRVLSYTPNRGKGYAVRTGMLAARGDFILFTDCDLAYGTAVIRSFYEAFVAGQGDIVIGSRTLDKSGYEGYTLKRKIMSKLYIRYLNTVAGFRHSDSQCGIKGFSRTAARAVFEACRCERWAFDLEALLIAQRLGFSVTELPVRVINHRDSRVRPLHDALQMTKEVRKIKKREKEAKKAAR